LEARGWELAKSTSVGERRTLRNVKKARGTDEVHWLGRRENPYRVNLVRGFGMK